MAASISKKMALGGGVGGSWGAGEIITHHHQVINKPSTALR